MKKTLQENHVVPVFIILLLGTFFTRNGYSQAVGLGIFRDDFNRDILGSSWLATPSWSIQEDAAYNFIDGVGGTLVTAKAFTDSSYIIETSAKGFNANYYRKFSITFGQANVSNDSMYQVMYTAYGGGTLTLYRSSDNIYYGEKLDEVAIYPALNSSQWYTFKIARYKSGLIQVYLDEGSGFSKTPLLEAIDRQYPEFGHTGWRIDTETYAENFYVDWFNGDKPAIEKEASPEKPSEDDLITQVTADDGNTFKVNKLKKGAKAFKDRDYIITSIPDYLQGASFIQTAMDDKSNSKDVFLTSFLTKDAIVYIAYDPRGKKIPKWLSDWTNTGDHIGVSDPGTNYLELYSKLFQYGSTYPAPLLLGGNMAQPANGAKMNYLVAAVERPNIVPLQAEDAALSGAVVATNHINYQANGFVDFINREDDFIEWTVDIAVPGIYNFGFQYANAGTADRLLDITDNGVSMGILPFSPFSTSWDSWAYISGPQVYLSNGTHKIRATATGTSGPNMDALSLYYSSAGNTALDAQRVVVTAYAPGVAPTKRTSAYPNPFSTNTNIYYELKEKAKVTLSVYSLPGQQMHLLVNGIKQPGQYKTALEGSKLSPGIYFYRLQIGADVTSGRLVKQ